jgi:GntR family transcriptional regulator/MocR family aminotransferase
MDPLFEIEIERVARGSRASSSSLYRQLKAAIAEGRLRPGTRLPPTRQAARFFGVSRNTAVEVYERLLNDGFVLARHGSGTYVAEPVAAGSARIYPERGAQPDRRLNALWLKPEISAAIGFWGEQAGAAYRPARTPAGIDFRPGLIDSRLFPFDQFRRIIAGQLRALEKKPARQKSPQGNQGNYHLRHAIAKHIALTRAVLCQPQDIVVTAGAQQAFDLLARILVRPGETIVAIEDPGYPPMRAALAAAGAKLVPVEVDSEGLVLEQLPPGVGVICVCPSHQFPLGVTLSARRRRALIEIARERGAVIIEDDYDGEFRHDGTPVKALREADPADLVFYVGTFSKCMLPALRLGFVVAPRWALEALIVAKNCQDWHCPTPMQLALSAFITEGHLARHVRKMRQLYQKRRQHLLASLERDFSQWLKPVPSLYGMHVAALACSAVDLDGAVQSVLGSHVTIHSLARYYMGQPSEAGLVFSYGTADIPQITRGLALLRDALAS